MRRIALVSVLLMAVSACSDRARKSGNNEVSDAGSDASEQTADAGTDVATGADDTGLDAGGSDDASEDTGRDVTQADMALDGPLQIPCDSSVDDVYATAVSPGENGEVLDCAVSESATAQQVRNRTLAIDGLDPKSGYTSYVVAYRTTRATGEPGVGTMLLYLPDTDVQQVASTDLVVANHGALAVPDDCAPSGRPHRLSGMNSVVLPWVGEGYPVAAPDFAGLGTAGVMGVGNTIDLGRAALDAAIAARNALAPGALTDRVLSLGQGEGAHAAYAMQALAADYAPSIDFAGAIGYATAYPQESYAELLRAGGVFPLVDGIGVRRAISALIAYTDFYNLFGAQRARDGLHPDLRDYVGDAVESECFAQLAVTLATDTADYDPPLIIAGLIDPTFRMDVVDCLNGNGCTADAQAFVDRAAATVQPLDADGGELLFVSAFGGANPGPQEQACLLEWMGDNGKLPEGCLWSGANNANISLKAGSYALDWGMATLAGETPPACPQDPFPACQ
jgi:hypothetical protein